MKYAYFPGCSLQGMAAEFDRSARAVCDQLGITLEEIPDWVCCGATPAHATSHLLSVALPAVTLAAVEQAAQSGGPATMVAACASCYNRLSIASHEVKEDAALRADVEEAAQVKLAGTVEVRHLLDILRNDLGTEAIRNSVTRPLSGLKVACYYGCLLLRPPKVVAFDDPNHPQIMEDLLTAAGAECVEWAYKTECCGASLSLARPDTVCKLVNDILREARDAGADLIATACPLCQTNLDVRQLDVAKAYGTRYNIPAIYFTQLLGIALGLPEKSLGLNRLIISPKPVLQKLQAAA
ncbi:MAG TPA: CoB--CoM heterodisulfide reductase iron-sulfur subunit B family protein [Armatimonadota bacterium]|nr:heterodisulfide reductase subunit B [Armatimonadota bacterium]HPT96323.1 CoB--CoM heterodisulfide reductase iron-sulfur subunit B family protein [Armatimonadota bacterium]